MKKILFCVLLSQTLFSQVGINTQNPEATLDIRGKNHLGAVTATDGVLVPRVTDLSTNGSVNGQLVYLTANSGTFTQGFHYWNGSAWTPFSGGGGAGDPSPDAWVDNAGNVVLTSGSVGIETNTPNTNAALDIASTTKGFLVPRLALVNSNNASPLAAHVAGMVVYNTATVNDVLPGLYINNGTEWKPASTPTKAPDTGSSILPGVSGNFISKGIPLNALTPVNSQLCLGNTCIRYNGSTATDYLEIINLTDPIYFLAYYNYGSSAVANTNSVVDSSTGNNWYQLYSFGGSANTEGVSIHLATVNKTTQKVTSYTINAEILIKSGSGLPDDMLFLRFYQN